MCFFSLGAGFASAGVSFFSFCVAAAAAAAAAALATSGFFLSLALGPSALPFFFFFFCASPRGFFCPLFLGLSGLFGGGGLLGPLGRLRGFFFLGW